VTDVRIVKLDHSGELIWERNYRGAGRDEVFHLVATSDGGFIAAGLSTSFGAWGHAPFVLKFDSDDNLVWKRGYLATGRDWGTVIEETFDNGFVLAGGTDIGGNHIQATLLKLNPGGEIAWQRMYHEGRLTGVRPLTDGGFLAVGVTGSAPPGEAAVLRLDANGDVLWMRTLGGPGNDGLYSVILLENGDFLAAGHLADDGWIVRMTESGTIAWQKSYGGYASDRLFSIRRNAEGHFVVSGETESFGLMSSQVWLLEIDGYGNPLWQRYYETGTTRMSSWMAVPTPDDDVVFAGGGDHGYTGSFVVLRVRSDGSIWSDCPDSLGVITTAEVVATNIQPVATATSVQTAPFVPRDLQLITEYTYTSALPICNAMPLLADAGDDQTRNEGEPVSLDGSGSAPAPHERLNFSWAQIAGSSVDIDSTDPVHPTFTAPYVSANETLTFQLVVDDGVSYSDPDSVDITVVNWNNPPVADAGDDTTVKEGSTSTLNGEFSYDPEGDPIEYEWTQVGGPAVVLVPDNTVVQPTFTAPEDAADLDVVFKLVVSDGRESSVPSPGADSSFGDTVAVTIVPNSPPLAVAGEDQTKDEGSSVTLNALGSYDPDGGDTLSYQWTQVGGIHIELADDTLPVQVFEAPAVSPGGEDLVFRLVVTDDDPVNPLSSAPDDVVIHVRNINDPPSCGFAVPSVEVLWPPNHKMIPVSIEGVMDEDSLYNQVTLVITGVTQDEPVNGLGDGDSSPDAVVQPDEAEDTVLLRAERSGTGNGRVYVVSFTADDGYESCTGAVVVTVPHSRKSVAMDDGQNHDSTHP
jgi:hypothetical protein